jgi:type III pantothenate kinase
MGNQSLHIAIDLGNSFAKMGTFIKTELVDDYITVPYESLAEKVNQINASQVIISSVNQQLNQLSTQIKAPLLILDHNTPIPIINKYVTPQTLGRDRLAAVIGAFTIESNVNTLVIDVGTCITYDFLNENNEYLGGSISPGIVLKYKALHNFTANLPLVDEWQANDLIGNSTVSAIASGVINGTIAEIEEIIRMYNDKFSHLRIIMCGGGAKELQSKLKIRTKLVPDLVLKGLIRILEYNV